MSDYDTDILTWSERQATLLRRRAAGELVNDADIDWPNVAEEIESVGRSERRELRNRMARLQQHLLKWRYQPEHRSRSWRTTITTQRREIEALLADSPSLRATLPDVRPPRIAQPATMPSPKPDCWTCLKTRHSPSSRR